MYGGWVFAIVITLAGIALAVLVPNPAAWIAAVVVVPVIWLALLLTSVLPADERRLPADHTAVPAQERCAARVADQILLVDIDDVTYVQGLVDRTLMWGKLRFIPTTLPIRSCR